MSKLHKTILGLGDLTGLSYADFVAACGEPKEKKTIQFTDVGEGTRALWSDGVFKISANFDKDEKFCGVDYHKHYGPHIAIAIVTAVLVVAALIIGAVMRKNASDDLNASAVEALLLGQQDQWLTDNTAGINLLDLDFDGRPELLVTDTEIVWYEELDMYYFGNSTVRVYDLAADRLSFLGEYGTDEYCYLTTLTPCTDASGKEQWYFTSAGDVYYLGISRGFSVTKAEEMPKVAEDAVAVRLLRNEAWVAAPGQTPGADAVSKDINAIAEEYFSNK